MDRRGLSFARYALHNVVGVRAASNGRILREVSPFHRELQLVVRHGVGLTNVTLTNDARRINEWIWRHEKSTVFGVGCARERMYTTLQAPQVVVVALSAGTDALVCVPMTELSCEREDVYAARSSPVSRKTNTHNVPSGFVGAGPQLPRRLVNLLMRGSSVFACGPRDLAAMLHDLRLTDASSPAWFRCKAYSDARADASRAGVRDPFPVFGDPEWMLPLGVPPLASMDAIFDENALEDFLGPTVIKQQWLVRLMQARASVTRGDGQVTVVAAESYLWPGTQNSAAAFVTPSGDSASPGPNEATATVEALLTRNLRYLYLPEPEMHVSGTDGQRLRRLRVPPYAVWRRGVSTRDSIAGRGTGRGGWQPGDAADVGVRFALRENSALAYAW